MGKIFPGRKFVCIIGALVVVMVVALVSSARAQTCNFTTSPTIVEAGHAGGTYTVNFTASDSACNWVVGSTEDWITVTSATRGTGSGMFTVTVKPNTGNATRQGPITFRRQYVWVDQQAETCTYTLTRSQYTLPHHLPFTLGLGITTNKPSCTWSIEETADWISLAPSSPKSGTGNGSFSLMFTQNTASSSRTAQIKIGGQTLTVTQPGMNAGCTYTINPSPLTLPHYLAYTRGFSITTNRSDCSWSIEESADWITIASSSLKSGLGVGYFTLNFAKNTSSETRTAEVRVGGKSVNITQPGMNAGCTYTINPSPLTLPHYLAYTRGFSITTNKPECSWSIEESADWITIASSSLKSGLGSGYFTLNFAKNTSSEARTAEVRVGEKSVSITQPGQNAGCTYTINPSPLTLPHYLAYTRGFSITTSKPDCSWSIEESADWITIASSSLKSGLGSGYFTLNFTKNTSSEARTAEVRVGGKSVNITQPGMTSSQTTPPTVTSATSTSAAGCSFVLSKTSQNMGSGNGRGSFTVKTGSGCAWHAIANAGWISITSGSSGSGNGMVKFSVQANDDSTERTGQINAAGQTFSITQKGHKASARDRRYR